MDDFLDILYYPGVSMTKFTFLWGEEGEAKSPTFLYFAFYSEFGDFASPSSPQRIHYFIFITLFFSKLIG